MVRKWYFCLSESSIERANHGWSDLLLAAVDSAIANTDLKPILLFDGGEHPILKTLIQKGVRVIHHRVKFHDKLKERDVTQPGYLPIASGAFLRTEIPLIEDEDEFVLYTDCDVVFLKNPDFSEIKPVYFSCAPQTSMTDYMGDANSGVLVLNTQKMRDSYEDFAKFICNNLNAGWPGCDQENYRRFYSGRWDHLPLKMNWKPYWGMSEDIDIIHWHGPKPEAIARKIGNSEFSLYKDWDNLYLRNKEAYSAFLNIWEQYGDPHFRNRIIGHIDIMSPDRIAGWAIYDYDRNRTATLNLFVNNKLIGSYECNGNRPDVGKIYNTKIGGFDILLTNKEEVKDSKLQLKDNKGNPVYLSHKGKIEHIFTL